MTQPSLPEPDATVLVEGRTAEEALERVHRDLGEDARILQAEKVRRGGVGGFFAREMVQLTVVAEEPTVAAEPGRSEPLFGSVPASERVEDRAPALVGAAPAPDPITRLAAATDADEQAFGAALRSALAVPSTTVPTPAPPMSQPPVAAAPEAAPAPAPPAAVAPAPAAAPASSVAPVPAVPEPAVEPEVVATALPRPGAAGPATARRAHWATAASRAGMRSLAQGAEALAATRIEAGEEDRAAREVRTIDLDAIGATAVATARVPAPAPAPAPPVAPVATAPRAVAPTPTPTPPAPARGTAPGTAVPRWSRDRLLRLGLSDALVDDVVAAGPTDDLGWMHALARVVEPLLQPAPAGDCVYVGGRVERHAKGAGATVCRPSDSAAPAGPLALARRPGESVRTWLTTHAADRWLHLVVGGEGWREWLWEHPAAVSWAAPEDLPVALGVARSFGLPLVGTVGVDGPVTAAAVDIAMAIRAMLERP